MTTLVHRYGPKGSFWKLHPSLRKYAVRDWQIWNEPAGTYDWVSEPWPAKYTELLKAGYKAVHAADPSAKVVTGAVVGLNGKNLTPWDQARSLYEAGAGKYFDILAVNAFTGGATVKATVENNDELETKVRAVMRAHGQATKPIWITEVASSSAQGRIPKKDYVGIETTPSGQLARLKAIYSFFRHSSFAGRRQVVLVDVGNLVQHQKGQRHAYHVLLHRPDPLAGRQRLPFAAAALRLPGRRPRARRLREDEATRRSAAERREIALWTSSSSSAIHPRFTSTPKVTPSLGKRHRDSSARLRPVCSPEQRHLRRVPASQLLCLPWPAASTLSSSRIRRLPAGSWLGVKRTACRPPISVLRLTAPRSSCPACSKRHLMSC